MFVVWLLVFLVLYLFLGWKFFRPSLRTRNFVFLLIAQSAVLSLSELLPDMSGSASKPIVLVALSPDGSPGPEVRSLHSDLSILILCCRICALVFISVALTFGPWFAKPNETAESAQSTA